MAEIDDGRSTPAEADPLDGGLFTVREAIARHLFAVYGPGADDELDDPALAVWEAWSEDERETWLTGADTILSYLATRPAYLAAMLSARDGWESGEQWGTRYPDGTRIVTPKDSEAEARRCGREFTVPVEVVCRGVFTTPWEVPTHA